MNGTHVWKSAGDGRTGGAGRGGRPEGGRSRPCRSVTLDPTQS